MYTINKKGVLGGSVLNNLLFIIHVNDIHIVRKIKLKLYEDDTTPHVH